MLVVTYTRLKKNLIDDLNLKRIIPGGKTQYDVSMLWGKDSDEDTHPEQSS